MADPICPRCKHYTKMGMFPHPKFKFVCTHCQKKMNIEKKLMKIVDGKAKINRIPKVYAVENKLKKMFK